MTENETYRRGTHTVRITTARITAGMRLLTETVSDTDASLRPAVRKTGATVRTVAGLTFHMDYSGRRAARVYTVTFTDGRHAYGLVPIYTWSRVTDEAPATAPAVSGSVSWDHPTVTAISSRLSFLR